MVASSSGSMATSGRVAASGSAAVELGEGDDRHRLRTRPFHDDPSAARRPPPGSGLLAAHHHGAEVGHLAEVGEDPLPALLVGEDHVLPESLRP